MTEQNRAQEALKQSLQITSENSVLTFNGFVFKKKCTATEGMV